MTVRLSVRHVWVVLLVAVSVIVLAACEEAGLGSNDYTVSVQVDGTTKIYPFNESISVGQFLQEINVRLGQDDDVDPPVQTQLRDGMRITITRKVVREECEETELGYDTIEQTDHSLRPGERVVAQTGKMGIGQVCYRVTDLNGQESSREEIRPRPLPIATPRNEIIHVGIDRLETSISIDGVMAYISGGQAWIIDGNTANIRQITVHGRLDGRVFDLSPDGRRLLYTRSTEDETDPDFSNELWVILDTSAGIPQPVQLIEDVRWAQWVPGQETTLGYSTALPSPDSASWSAFNDLFVMQLDPETGEIEAVDEIISPNSLGMYAYWGRRYAWSPDGSQIAWANANGVGVIDQENNGSYLPLLQFTQYETALLGSWVWVPTLSWSDEGLLITTVHGPPYEDEPPEDSIIFDTAVVEPASGLQVNPMFSASGIWSSPVFSPTVRDENGYEKAWVAYFRAREPHNSRGTEYDLVIADSDGSNPRVLFPGASRPGLRAPDPEDGLRWSPDATKIALVYERNLWIVDVDTGLDYQITNDGQATRPRWSREP